MIGRSHLNIISFSVFAILIVMSGLYFVSLRYSSKTQEGHNKEITTTNNFVSQTTRCPMFGMGDIDCNNIIDLSDFDIWLSEYIEEPKMITADINNDTKVSLMDYEIWRGNFSSE